MGGTRRTFRERAEEVCYQRQVRDEMAGLAEVDRLFPRPADTSLKRARVRPIGRALAWKVISRYEWLGTLPANCTDYFGLFFGDICGGVACYAVGNVGAGGVVTEKMFGVKQTEIAYLARGACVHWAPVGSAPKLINFSARMTGAQLALAYSDTDAGEIGTVYQAAGWTCLGKSVNGTAEYVSPLGRVYNQMLPRDLARKQGGTTDAWRTRLLSEGWTRQRSNTKIRYVLLLERGRRNPLLVERVAKYAVPYPKRGEKTSSTRSGPAAKA